MPPIPPISCIVFDLGGVIVRICRSVHEAGARAGVAIPEDELAPEKRAARKAVHALYERGELTTDEFCHQLAETTRFRITPEQYRRIHEAWIIDEYAGVSELIDDLHAQSLITGVLSNTNESHWRQLVGDPARNISPMFPTPSRPRHVHASHLLRLAKPDPRIYAVFSRLSGTDPSRTLFFDDLEPNILAARAAGWQACQIDHTGDPASQMRAHLKAMGIVIGASDSHVPKQ